ncbi:uncharacterized protein LOC132196818 [Neocloeon triangulifer]|uniref:uncharacterized protein LOC132196818 n=1 Tax=Neocloeon triangulifer TaxID=2078957 RepID=UPI00286EBFE7|nr:uncharacterized protein LOC132196818 [Neocloeon triangulifer]XP_059475711.1 uncharacterized protein LOC132196818 [Neocloeon triangulifer]XP_059475719.1 uncharacterized protein LOC132196818 [Neocloeon triangulifer]XP_059475729.1 uncharacterized protein LOC132196818 [Neocloeon triangulifer]
MSRRYAKPQPYYDNNPDRAWASSPLDNVYTFQNNLYHEERSGLPNPNEYRQQNHYSNHSNVAGPSSSYANYSQHQNNSFHQKFSSHDRQHQDTYQQQGHHQYNKQNFSNLNKFQSINIRQANRQTNTYSRSRNSFKDSDDFARDHNQQQSSSYTDFHQDKPSWSSSGSSVTKPQKFSDQPPMNRPVRKRKNNGSKYYRHIPPGGRARPGLRSFCSYVTNRNGSSKLNGPKSNLQFVYKIKACLWHRTKMGLHKKKTKLFSKQWRYRQIRQNNLFIRKTHSQYWSRSFVKPKVSVKASNPWKNFKSSFDYLSLVASFTPASWQDPKFAYFHHVQYQLFTLPTNGLEFISLENQMICCKLKIVQVIRLQNLLLYGAYISKKQQLLANSILLREVVRYFCIKAEHLKELCKYGHDLRRIGEVKSYVSPREAHMNRPETNSEVLMVAARVVIIPVKYPRSSNEVYPEYIMQYSRVK